MGGLIGELGEWVGGWCGWVGGIGGMGLVVRWMGGVGRVGGMVGMVIGWILDGVGGVALIFFFAGLGRRGANEVKAVRL